MAAFKWVPGKGFVSEFEFTPLALSLGKKVKKLGVPLPECACVYCGGAYGYGGICLASLNLGLEAA
jgi:hypothetical protein